jgi:hypothetical protein
MTKLTNEQVEMNENAMYTLALVKELNEEDAQALIGHTPNDVRQALVLLQIQVEKLEAERAGWDKQKKELIENANIAAAHVKRQAHLKYKAQKELKKLQDGLMDENNKVVICDGMVHFEAIDARV